MTIPDELVPLVRELLTEAIDRRRQLAHYVRENVSAVGRINSLTRDDYADGLDADAAALGRLLAGEGPAGTMRVSR